MARGTPDEGIYTPEVQAADLPRKTLPNASGISVGSTVEGIGDILGAKYAADSSVYASNKAADLNLQAAQTFKQMQDQAGTGDPGNFTPNFLAAYDKQAQAALQSADGNPIATKMLTQSIQNTRRAMQGQALDWEASQRKISQNLALKDNLDGQLPLVRANPELRDSVGETLMAHIGLSNNAPDVKQTMAREVDAKLTHQASLGFADQNPLSAYDQLKPDSAGVTNPYLAQLKDPTLRADVLAHATGKIIDGAAQNVLDAYRNGGPNAGHEAYGAVDELNLPDDLKDKVRSTVQAKLGELRAQSQQENADTVIALHRDIASGKPTAQTRASAWDLYNNNAIDGAALGSILGEVDRAERAQTDAGAGLGLIDQAWNNNYKLDPKDPHQKKDAQEYFDQLADRNNAKPGSPMYTNLAVEFARRTNMIPESVGEWTRTALTGSQDPAEVYAAATAIDRLRAIAPKSFEYFDDDKRLSGMADSIVNLTRGGMDPTLAVQTAQKRWSEPPDERATLDREWNAVRPFGRGDSALAGVVRQAIASDPKLADVKWYWTTVPTVPDGMQADFARTTRAYFDADPQHDIAAAEKSAARDVGHTWGITHVNGDPELVRWPIERVFRAPDGSPGITASDVRDSLAQYVKDSPDSFLRWDPEKHEAVPFTPDPTKLKLVPNKNTDPTGGLKWGVAYDEGHGAPEVLFDKDHKVPLEYTVPATQKDYAALRAAEKQRLEAEADARYQKQKQEESAALARVQSLSSGTRPVR